MCLVKVRLEDGVGESVVRGPNRILYRIYLGKQADTLWRLFEISSYSELSLESGGCKFCRRFRAVLMLCLVTGKRWHHQTPCTRVYANPVTAKLQSDLSRITLFPTFRLL